MSAATVTDITTAVQPQEKAKSDNISLSISLPEKLYDKIKLDSMLSKVSIGKMVDDWADQNVNLQNVNIGLANLMQSNIVREKPEPGVVMKGLSIPVSKRTYSLIRMEAIRQQTTIRALVRSWIEENCKEWLYEPVEEQHQWPERQAA